MRPEAKFADGSLLTADDVVFTFKILKEKGHPIYRVLLKDATKARALDRQTVRYTFTGTEAGAFDLREEFTSRDWATAYDIAAVKEGRLILLTLPDQNPSGAQGFFLNTRRPKLADVRVRKVLDNAFYFEWINKNIFYDLYAR